MALAFLNLESVAGSPPLPLPLPPPPPALLPPLPVLL
jgi:hypothetical protein